MSEAIKIDLEKGLRDLRSVYDRVFAFIQRLLATRLALYTSDLIMMKIPRSIRYQQLSMDHLLCRFCGFPIELLGSWKCGCGFKRPGSYFGRCPKCLSHPDYIDCPSCGFTMRVR